MTIIVIIRYYCFVSYTTYFVIWLVEVSLDLATNKDQSIDYHLFLSFCNRSKRLEYLGYCPINKASGL